MTRPASIVRHDDIARAEKALRTRGLSIAKLTIFRDRVEIVPDYGDSGNGLDNALDAQSDHANLPEPKL